MARLLFIVSRHQPDLYAHLCRQFAAEPDMKVVLDRRRGERRRDSAPRPDSAERRQGDRRQNIDVAHQLLTMGYAFARAAPAVASSPTG
jgi:hypothetical protein